MFLDRSWWSLLSGSTGSRKRNATIVCTPLRSPANHRLASRPLGLDELEERVLLTIGTSNPTISSTPEAPQILLTPSVLAAMQQQASANTAQWQAFKAQLDQGLNTVVEDIYQGSNLPEIADYALGYQVLKNSDPTTAGEYADKAIAIMKSGLNDYQEGSWEQQQFLARGDGSATTFTLANSDVVPSSLHVFLAPIATMAVVHGAANGQDPVQYYSTFLKASNTPDGPADYTQGMDWQHNGNYANDMIDWSLGSGNQPAVGATYYVTYATEYGDNNTAFTLNGNQITLSTAPTANQAVFVEYVYGTHAADGSTLAYQQTSAGDGGLNSIMADTGYTARFLGYVAMGLDWLDGYVGMSTALKTQTVDTLQQWYNYDATNSYHANAPDSNYGAGSYFMRSMIALALEGRSSDGPAFLSDIVAYRTNNLLPLLENATTSLAGGFYDEGWNYGALATQNIIMAGLALEADGQVNAAPEHHWATQVIEQLVSDQASQSTVFDGGDGYAYPEPFPGNHLIATLSSAADDPAARDYANYILQNYNSPAYHDALDLLFDNPGAQASYWSALPLQNYASGTGLLTVRSDWGSNPDWASIQIGNLLNGDHAPHVQGQVQIQRGADDLLVNANTVTGNQDEHIQSSYGNTIVVDDNGDGAQNYRYNMGFWYGNPGVTVNAYEAGNNYTYLYGDYHAAYSLNSDPGGGGPTSELTRQFVYLRPDLVIVYDRATTINAAYLKEQQWMMLNAPTVSGNSFVETVGGSKLFGQTYSTAPLTTTTAPATLDGATVQRLITQNSSPTASVRYATAFQIAPSSTGSMDASQHVLSADSQLEGIEIGGNVVLFGRNGEVNTSSAITYQVTSGGSLSQLITNLPVGQNYEIDVNGTPTVIVKASSQGTINFTTTGSGSQTITITETTQTPQSPLALGDSYQLAAGSTTVVDAVHGLLANDSDPASLTLTATVQTGPAHGFLTLNPDGSFTYSKGADFSGADSFTYVASDGQNTSLVTTVTLASLPPTAANDLYVISNSPTSSIGAAQGVLAGDSNPGGGAMTAVLQTGPRHGTLTLNADGSFTYTVSAGFSGIDSFTYIAASGGLSSGPATVTLLSQPAAVVRKIYDQVLLRDADTAGIEYWTSFIGAGGSYAQVAQGILESDERLDRLIGQFYQQYLHRAIDAAGLAYWRDSVWKRDGGPQNVEAGMIGSPEFYASSGGTNAAWVTALYQRLLNRVPDAAGLNYWTNQLAAGAQSREQIVLGFVRSGENYINAVDGWFADYMGRPADAGAINTFVAEMQQGASDRDIELGLIGSAEYRSTPALPAGGTLNRIS